MSANPHAPAWSSHAHERLSSAGYRRGGARRAVIDLLNTQHCALSAAEIEERLRDGTRGVGRASVYRVLEELEELHLVTRVGVGDGVARFEAHHPEGGHHHHHLFCGECGEILPFEDDELERSIRRVAGKAGFEMTGHDITLHGTCEACARARRGSQPSP